MSLHKYNRNPELLSDLVNIAGGESDHITDTLTTKLRLLSEDALTIQSLCRMQSYIFLIEEVVSTYGFRRSNTDRVKTVAVIAKSLSKVAAAFVSPSFRDDDQLPNLVLSTIFHGLVAYDSLSGYPILTLAIAVLRLGFFDVILAVDSIFVEMKSKGFDTNCVLQVVHSLLPRVLPEFLFYSSFV